MSRLTDKLETIIESMKRSTDTKSKSSPVKDQIEKLEEVLNKLYDHEYKDKRELKKDLLKAGMFFESMLLDEGFYD